MNLTQFECFLVLLVLAIIGFGPISFTCLIGFHIVIARPPWFLQTVRDLYHDKPGRSEAPMPTGSSGAARIKCFLILLFLLILDIAPVPVTGSIGLVIVLMRPLWFQFLVERIYAGVPM